MLYFLKNKIFLNQQLSLALRDHLWPWVWGGPGHRPTPPHHTHTHNAEGACGPAGWSPSPPGCRFVEELCRVYICRLRCQLIGPLLSTLGTSLVPNGLGFWSQGLWGDLPWTWDSAAARTSFSASEKCVENPCYPRWEECGVGDGWGR